MAAQDLGGNGVEGAEPGHALDLLAHIAPDALLHLAGSLVGEGDGENLRRPCLSGRKNMGNARRQHPCLAGAGTCQDQNWPFKRFHRRALLRVEPFEIAGRLCLARGKRARCNPSRLSAGRGIGCASCRRDLVKGFRGFRHLPECSDSERN